MARTPDIVRPLLVFVCTGNVCRSPMAEYLLHDRLPADSPWEIFSAGVAAIFGFPASEPAIAALRERGIDLSPHRSTPLTATLIEAADLIVVMSRTHYQHVAAVMPTAAAKVFLLASFDKQNSNIEIDDPIGMPIETYRRVRNEIESALSGLIAFMHTVQRRDDKGST